MIVAAVVSEDFVLAVLLVEMDVLPVDVVVLVGTVKVGLTLRVCCTYETQAAPAIAPTRTGTQPGSGRFGKPVYNPSGHE